MSATPRLGTGRSSQFVDGGGGSVLELIQTITVAGPTDVVTFLGLDGNVDGYYILHATILAGDATGGSIHLRPNGSDANLESLASVNTGIAIIPLSETFAFLVESGAIGSLSLVEAEFFAKAGTFRGGRSLAFRGVGSTNEGVVSNFGWADGASNITSLDVFDDGGSGVGIGVGSVLSLYRLKQ